MLQECFHWFITPKFGSDNQMFYCSRGCINRAQMLGLLLLCIKFSLLCSMIFAEYFVWWPRSPLTFTGAIGCTATSAAIYCFATFNISIGVIALRVVAKAQLCNRLHFFVFRIQATAGNAPPQEFYQRMVVGGCIRHFDDFRPINKGLFARQCCVVLLKISCKSRTDTRSVFVSI